MAQQDGKKNLENILKHMQNVHVEYSDYSCIIQNKVSAVSFTWFPKFDNSSIMQT